MSAKMHVVLEGLPERIQETADILDQAFPGLISWHRLAKLGPHHLMRLEGIAASLTKIFQPPKAINSSITSAKAWKLSSSTTQGSPQGKRFCASLARNLQA